jgi:hypothetical protein
MPRVVSFQVDRLAGGHVLGQINADRGPTRRRPFFFSASMSNTPSGAWAMTALAHALVADQRGQRAGVDADRPMMPRRFSQSSRCRVAR